MSRRYTANDFRETADDFENYADLDESVIADMLRQAADMLGREKKYEYAERIARSDRIDYRHYDSKNDVEHERELSSVVVRREVGEWEVLPND